MIFSWLKPKTKNQSAQDDAPRRTAVAEELLQKRAKRQQKALEKDARRNAKNRVSARSSSFAPAVFHIPDAGVRLDGVISDASAGGVTFRPASNFIQEMDGKKVHLTCEGIARAGIVRSTRVDGYGVQVFEKFSEAELRTIQESSLNIAEWHAA